MTPEDRAYCERVVVAGAHEAKYHTLEMTERVIGEKIKGVFAEAGVMAGGHIAIMDYALRKHSESRDIYAFDSFDGIPQATEDDEDANIKVYGVRKPGEQISSSGVSRVDLPGFWYYMRQWKVREEYVIPVPGWFQETLPRFSLKAILENISFALLRVDVDLLESVRFCLKYLFPRLSSGGYFVFDDWGMLDEYHVPKNRETLFGMTGLSEKDFSHVEGNPGTVWWRKP